MIKGSYHQEVRTTERFMHLIRVSKYMKQKLDRNTENSASTTAVRDLNPALPVTGGIRRKPRGPQDLNKLPKTLT